MIISFSLTNSSDNSENFESSLVVWKNQRLHELASIWHSRYFWKMIAVLPTFSPAICHLETLLIPSPSPFLLYAVSRRGLDEALFRVLEHSYYSGLGHFGQSYTKYYPCFPARFSFCKDGPARTLFSDRGEVSRFALCNLEITF